jgi:hypothetical protein
MGYARSRPRYIDNKLFHAGIHASPTYREGNLGYHETVVEAIAFTLSNSRFG